jgi:[acyl-carrier-protein] S-malonyltransferase
LRFEDALLLVSARAQAMQAACEANPGTMAAVLGLSDEKVVEICEAQESGVVDAANFNCPGQVVISGEPEAVDAACAAMKEAGARRALRLPVGGAFHSPLMAPAAEELREAILKTEFRKPFCPIYQNVSAKAEIEPEIIRENLLKQLTSPVLWTQSVQNMIADGATEFYEFGPGDVLKGLIRKINPDVMVG